MLLTFRNVIHCSVNRNTNRNISKKGCERMSKSVSITEIIDVIGEEMTQKLIDNFAGRTCYFKKDPKTIEFPDQESKEQFARNAFYSGAMALSEIADYLELSVDHVRKLINKR